MRRLAAVLLIPIALAAQQPAADSPALVKALAQLKTDNAWTLQKQVALCEIPAPPFKEQARGVAFRKEMLDLGYADAHIDDVGNVVAEVPGATQGPTVMLAGHLDTVFPEGTNVTVTREGTRFKGPGIGDDCRGLAVVLSTARAVKQSGVRFAGRVIFVANVGEEGAGNLRGTRHLLGTTHKGKVVYFISVDGAGNDIVSRAVGSNRYKVHFLSPGGHSYGAFGMPNAIHAMGRAIAAISDIQVPRSPKTTFNVGIVSGGTSVNSIPMEGVMDVDMRSESAEELAKVDVQVRKAIENAVAAELARAWMIDEAWKQVTERAWAWVKEQELNLDDLENDDEARTLFFREWLKDADPRKLGSHQIYARRQVLRRRTRTTPAPPCATGLPFQARIGHHIRRTTRCLGWQTCARAGRRTGRWCARHSRHPVGGLR